MGKVISGGRAKKIGASCATVAALVLSCTSNIGVGNASVKQSSASRAGANVFVDPTPSKDLWVSTMDPGAVQDVDSADVINKIYAGLLKQAYDDKAKRFNIVPDLAAAMPTVSKGGLVYTFKIRKDARFSDGSRVTAQDAVYSINRALLPAEQSPIASFYLADIVGSGDVVSGKAKTCKGLKAIGTDTVEITLDRPVAYFLYSFTYPTSDVLKQNVAPGAKLTTSPSLVVGAGPFMLKGGTWKYRSQITLVPNPYFYNARNIKLKEIDIPFVGSVATLFNAYKSGQYPTAPLPSVEISRYRGQPEFHETPVLGDLWLAMNPKYPPFNNRDFRRAVSFAINRDAIINGVLHGSPKKLDSWYPAGITGYDPNITVRVPHYDAAMAKQELATALKTIKRVPSGVQLEYPSDNEDTARVAAAVQSDLKSAGIAIGLHGVPGTTWLKDLAAKKTPLILNDWYDDYPDPQDFSEVLAGTGGGSNGGAYSNKQVDQLFAKADVEHDAATREKLYKQAQEIILNDGAMVMLYQFQSHALYTTKWHGMELNPSWGANPEPVANNWANVTVSP